MSTENAENIHLFTALGPGKSFSVSPFFLTVFASWLLWIPAGARKAGVLPFPFPSELVWLGVFLPMIFSFLFIYRYGGLQGLQTHLQRFIHWRFPKIYWVMAILAFPLIGLACAAIYSVLAEPILSTGLARIIDGTVSSELMSRYRANSYESVGLETALFNGMAASPIIFLLGYLVLAITDGGISEEPGWRGFAYPILQDRWGSLPAAVAVGGVWALWHLGPRQWEILFGKGLDAFLAFLPGHFLLYVIAVTPLAIIFGWLYERTGGSLLACFLIHASFNTTSLIASFAFPEAPLMLGVIVAMWLFVGLMLRKQGWRQFAVRGA